MIIIKGINPGPRHLYINKCHAQNSIELKPVDCIDIDVGCRGVYMKDLGSREEDKIVIYAIVHNNNNDNNNNNIGNNS